MADRDRDDMTEDTPAVRPMDQIGRQDEDASEDIIGREEDELADDDEDDLLGEDDALDEDEGDERPM